MVTLLLLYGLVVLGLFGLPYYQKKIAPWRKAVLIVNNEKITTRQFLQKLRLQPDTTGFQQLEAMTRLLQELEKEILIRQEGERQGITLSKEELDQEIRNRFLEEGSRADEFPERYAAFLKKTGLKEGEHRAWVRTDLYRSKLLQAFRSQIPDRQEQVHLSIIVLGSPSKAEWVREQLQKGADFTRMARETSIDLETSRKGGEWGWFPKGVEDLTTPGQVKALGVLVKTKPEADSIREKIRAGSDIKELARRYSLDQKSKGKGGMLGWISADFREGGPFGPEIYALAPGEISRPLPSPEGYWVIKVLDKTPRGRVIDDIAFSLPTGKVSPPLNTERGFFFIQVLAKEVRPLTSEHQNLLARNRFAAWLEETAEKGRKEGRIRWDWGSEAYLFMVRQLN